MRLIQDIIALKKKHRLIEDDATDDKQSLWYDFSIKNGLVIAIYSLGKLVGFCEFVRLSRPPEKYDDIYDDDSNYIDGNTCFVSNCIAEDSSILWQLKRHLFALNRDCQYYVWNRKKNDKLKTFRRKKWDY